MKAPKCRVCQVEHWGEVHVWSDEPKAKLVEPALATTLATKHGKYADSEKRKAYQRDLMRKRRAAGKS